METAGSLAQSGADTQTLPATDLNVDTIGNKFQKLEMSSNSHEFKFNFSLKDSETLTTVKSVEANSNPPEKSALLQPGAQDSAKAHSEKFEIKKNDLFTNTPSEFKFQFTIEEANAAQL